MKTNKEIEHLINNRTVQTFRIKHDASIYAEKVGWHKDNVIKIERRFESVWLAAKKDSNNLILPTFFEYNFKTNRDEIKTIVASWEYKLQGAEHA